MGQFGQLVKLHNIVYFRLSPYEQKAFAGFIKDGVPNLIRRMKDHVLRTVPFFMTTHLIINWADEEYWKLNRKNPELYKNDT